MSESVVKPSGSGSAARIYVLGFGGVSFRA